MPTLLFTVAIPRLCPTSPKKLCIASITDFLKQSLADIFGNSKAPGPENPKFIMPQHNHLGRDSRVINFNKVGFCKTNHRCHNVTSFFNSFFLHPFGKLLMKFLDFLYSPTVLTL